MVMVVKKDGEKTMKDLCIELVDEILNELLDMEDISLNESYEESFFETQEMIMNDPKTVINALLELNDPNYELIAKIQRFSDL